MTDRYWNYLRSKFNDRDDVLPDPAPATGADLVPAADPVPLDYALDQQANAGGPYPVQSLVERLRYGNTDFGTLILIAGEAADALEAQAREIERLKTELTLRAAGAWDNDS